MMKRVYLRGVLSTLNSWFALTRREKTVVVFLVVSLLVGESILLIKRRWNRVAEELVTGERWTTEQLIEKSDSLVRAGKEYLKVDINRATADELKLLPGIGQAIAREIIAYRQETGPFREPSDIMQVSGIGEGKYAAIRECIVVTPTSPDPLSDTLRK